MPAAHSELDDDLGQYEHVEYIEGIDPEEPQDVHASPDVSTENPNRLLPQMSVLHPVLPLFGTYEERYPPVVFFEQSTPPEPYRVNFRVQGGEMVYLDRQFALCMHEAFLQTIMNPLPTLEERLAFQVQEWIRKKDEERIRTLANRGLRIRIEKATWLYRGIVLGMINPREPIAIHQQILIHQALAREFNAPFLSFHGDDWEEREAKLEINEAITKQQLVAGDYDYKGADLQVRMSLVDCLDDLKDMRRSDTRSPNTYTNFPIIHHDDPNQSQDIPPSLPSTEELNDDFESGENLENRAQEVMQAVERKDARQRQPEQQSDLERMHEAQRLIHSFPRLD